MRFLYSFGIVLYTLGIKVASLFNSKAKLWTQGRKNLLSNIQESLQKEDSLIWVHAASLGEYEQAKPLIETIKFHNPDVKILTTFFSPSGYVYAAKEKNNVSDYIFYLPTDTPQNAEKFVQIVKPMAAFFVKYEYWFNFMQTLHNQNVPFYYVSAIFRKNQYFFKGYGRWFAKHLKYVSHFFVQNNESEILLNSLGITKVSVCGDTRFDRVKKVADEVQSLEFMERFTDGKKLIVAGSTWLPDEQLLSELLHLHKNYKLVVAPHEISRTPEVIKLFSDFKVACYSEMNVDDLNLYDVLIIDAIGILKKLYKYSSFSYIGGAFKTGLHNILEAAVYGKPLFFGPKYDHFLEAVELVRLKGAFSVNGADEMSSVIKKCEDSIEYYENVCKICQDFVNQNLGACDSIYKEVEQLFLRENNKHNKA